MHHRHKDPLAWREAARARARRDERGDDYGGENRGEPYYNEPWGGRFGEPPARDAAERSPRDRENSEYASFGHYGEYRGGGRWTASPDLPRHLQPAGPMAGTDVSHERGAYYYGPRGEEDRQGDYRYRDDDRYEPYGRDLGVNWTRPGRYPGYAETQGHSASGAESYRGLGPKGYRRADAHIQDEVCERLTDDERVDARDVVVATKNGVVTLDGSVPRRWMKYCAEDVAEHCSGVTDVVNRLTVRRDADRPAQEPAAGGVDVTKKH
jgi:hypothetical protein